MRHNSDARNRPRGRRVRRFCLDPKRLREAPEAPRDDAAPSSAPAVSVEPAYDAAEPSPSSPFTYDGAGDRAARAAVSLSIRFRESRRRPQERLTAEEDAPTDARAQPADDDASSAISRRARLRRTRRPSCRTARARARPRNCQRASGCGKAPLLLDRDQNAPSSGLDLALLEEANVAGGRSVPGRKLLEPTVRKQVRLRCPTAIIN